MGHYLLSLCNKSNNKRGYFVHTEDIFVLLLKNEPKEQWIKIKKIYTIRGCTQLHVICIVPGERSSLLLFLMTNNKPPPSPVHLPFLPIDPTLRHIVNNGSILKVGARRFVCSWHLLSRDLRNNFDVFYFYIFHSINDFSIIYNT